MRPRFVCPNGADVFAGAMLERVASRYMIVGGRGHTTGALRRSLRERMGWEDVAHVEVPPEVRRAFGHLRETSGFAARAADARWAG